MKSKQPGEGSTSNASNVQQIPGVTNPNVRIVPSLFNGTSYKDWAYSAEWLLRDLKELGILLEALKNQKKRIQHTQIGYWRIFSNELDSQFYGRGNCRKFQIL